MTRINNEALNEAMVPLKTTNPFPSVSTKENTTKQVYFAFAGNEDRFGTKFGIECENGYPLLDEDSDLALAKADYSTNVPRYYVKVNSNGFFADPHSLFGDNAKQAKIRGRNTVEYKLVKEESFLHYIQFLKTMNRQQLRQAERTIQ